MAVMWKNDNPRMLFYEVWDMLPHDIETKIRVYTKDGDETYTGKGELTPMLFEYLAPCLVMSVKLPKDFDYRTDYMEIDMERIE